MKKIFYLLFALLISVSATYAQGYKIEVKIKGAENQDIILGHHKNDNLIPDDTVKTDKNGYGVFKGKKPLHEGMYFIFLPSKTYFDFIVGKDQNFYLQNDTTDLLKDIKVKGSQENQLFADYHIFMAKENEKIADLRKQYTATKNKKEKEKIKAQLKDIGKLFEQRYNEIVSKYPNMFFTTFLKATKGVDVPDSIKSRQAQYYYYKKHYFDNFDLSDPRLLYTPFYDQKIDMYLDKVVPPNPDSINAAIDMMLSKAQGDSLLYQYLLVHLFNKYARSEYMIAENIYVHLADIYIKKATWSTDSFKNELKTKIIRKKNCLIGKTAPELHMTILPNDSAKIEELRVPLAEMRQKGLKIEKDTSRTFEQKLPDLSELIAEYLSYFPSDAKLSEVKAKYTILWFLSPTCSHCIEETPKFYKDFQKKLEGKGVVVWAIYLEKNTDNWAKFSKDFNTWFDFVEKNKFYDKGWYNMLNPFDNYRFKYDISSSPVLYLLDRNKKILAKKIGYKQAIEIIENMNKAGK